MNERNRAEKEPVKKDEPDPLKDPASGEPEPPHKDVEDVDDGDEPDESSDADTALDEDKVNNPSKQSER